MSAELLILHGALGSAAQFKPLQARLAVPSTIVEFHGHGNAPDVEGPWSIEVFAEQLEAAIQTLPSPLPIFGYSMGGYVALWLAMSRPDLVPRLLTLGTKLDWSDARVMAGVPDERMVGLMARLHKEPLLTVQNVSTLTIPVRYCVGDRDRMVSIEETIAYYRATPGAELCVLPNTRHMIEKVDVDVLAEQVSRFLRA